MKDIIADAQKASYTVPEDDPKKQGILISDAWMAKLHSIKIHLFTFVEKPGTGIFLMKESSKMYRPQKKRENRRLTKRLGGPSVGSSDTRNLGEHRTRDRTLGEVSSARYRHRSKGTRR